MTDLYALRKRVEGLQGPSQLIDAELYATIGGAPHVTTAGDRTIPFIEKGDPLEHPAYTSSVDAALALVERKLPGWPFWRAGRVPGPHWENGVLMEAWCHLSRVDASNALPRDEATGWAHTVPAAIILALLRALESTNPNTEKADG